MNDEGAPFITKKYTPPSRFVLIRFADFTPLEGDDYCVKGFLPRTGLAVFWGPPKSGKSFFVFDLLMHVAFGWDYRGRHVRQGPVVYVCLEAGAASVSGARRSGSPNSKRATTRRSSSSPTRSRSPPTDKS